MHPWCHDHRTGRARAWLNLPWAAHFGRSRMTRSTAPCAAASAGRRRRRHRRGKMDAMAALKDRLRSDLTAAMKARDEVTVRTLRMALTSVSKEEVAGASARELSDDEVITVLTR